MKRSKAANEDGITEEMLEELDEIGMKINTGITNTIYSTGKSIEQMCQSVFIVIPKIQGTLERNKDRIISIMSHLTNIVLRVITNTIKIVIRPEIAVEQYELNRDCSTRNTIFVIRIAENMVEVQKKKKMYSCVS